MVISRWDADVTQEQLGWAGRVSKCSIGGRAFVRVDSCAADAVAPGFRASAARRRHVSTVVVTAPSQATLDVVRVAAEVRPSPSPPHTHEAQSSRVRAPQSAMRGLQELSEAPYVLAGGGCAEVLAAAHVRRRAAADGAGAATAAVAGALAGSLERIADALGGPARGRDDPPSAALAAAALARARSGAFRCTACGGAVGAPGRAGECVGWDALAGAPAVVLSFTAGPCVCAGARGGGAAAAGAADRGGEGEAEPRAAVRVAAARVVDVRRVRTSAVRFAVEAASVVLRVGGYASLLRGAVHSEWHS